MMIWWDVYIVFLSYDVRLFKAEHMMDAIHMIGIPSGNLLQFAIEAMVIFIVDFPIKNGDVPWLC